MAGFTPNIFGQSAVTTNTSVFGSSSISSSASTNPFQSTTPAAASSSTLFGQSTTASIFGSTAVANSMSPFGTSSPFTMSTSSQQQQQQQQQQPSFASSSSSSLYGASAAAATNAPTLFGGAGNGTSPLFGSAAATAPPSGSIATASLFGSNPAAASTPPSMFAAGSSTAPSPSPIFGSAPASTALFSASPTQAASPFGTGATTASSLFATTTSSPLFRGGGSTAAPSLFGAAGSATSPSLFGGASSTTTPSLFGGAGSTTMPSLFSGTSSTTAPSLFGSASATTTPSLFGVATSAPATPLFGTHSSSTPTLFGGSSPSTTPFGTGTAATTIPSLFGLSSATAAKTTTTTLSLFGTTSTTPSLFGGTISTTTASLFGAKNPLTTGTSLFGTTTAVTTTSATTSTVSIFSSAAVGTTSTNIFGGSGAFSASNVSAPSGSVDMAPTSTPGVITIRPNVTTSTTSVLGTQPSVFGQVSASSSSPGSRNVSVNLFGATSSRPSSMYAGPFKPISTIQPLMTSATPSGGVVVERLRPSGPTPAQTAPGDEEEIERGTSPVRPAPIAAAAAVVGAPPPRRRRSSGSHVEDCNALLVKGLSHTDSRPALKRHFDKFGPVTDVRLNMRLHQATVTFQDHDSAARAKQNGRVMNAGTPRSRNLVIFFKTPTKTRSEAAAAAAAPTPAAKTSKTAKLTELAVDPDVNSELIAMGGGAARDVDAMTSSSLKLSHAVVDPFARRVSPEPYRESTPPIVTSKVRSQLLSGAPVHANSNLAKWDVLKERDRILRARVTKNTDLRMAKVVAGTCVDMCPETERYMRQEQRRLSTYEMVDGTERDPEGPKVDHALAVKEYSRSAADQDEPLPHDLRPVQTLDRTMNYLMRHVMDTGGEGQWENYYEFIWNRTRAIRKDITLQHLNGPEAVDLVEKCARWHAYCAERLCQEDHNIFDQKVNTENLTKCLESLKQFYDDLAPKNVFCPNEAEFRSYVVLLNLNDGDTLRIVQNLRPEVRGAEVVQVAVQIHAALNRSNYVRFFRLVKGKATFLQACICHRYFSQIRSEGMKRIVNVYTHGKSSAVPFPLSRLVAMLGFEGEAEAESHCVSRGLKVAGDVVILERPNYVEPEGVTPSRAVLLIEAKMTGSTVGEIVNGNATVPDVELAGPTCSFDVSGLFVQDLKDVAGVEEGEVITPSSSATSAASTTEVAAASSDTSIGLCALAAPTPPRVSTPDVDKEAVLRDVVEEIVRDVTHEMINDIFSDMCMLDGVLHSVVDEIAHETADEVTRASVKCVVEELEEEDLREAREKLLEDMKRAEEAKKLEAELARDAETGAVENIAQNLIEDVAAEISREVVDEEMSLVEATLLDQFVEALGEEIRGDLLLDVCDEMTDSIARQCHREWVSDVLDSLVDVTTRRQTRIARSAFDKWRAVHLRKMRKKAALESLPPMAAGDAAVAALSAMSPPALKLAATESLREIAEKLTDRIALRVYGQQKIRKESLTPFDMAEIFGKTSSAGKSAKSRICTKLIILIADGDFAGTDPNVKWFLNKFRKGQVAPEMVRKFDLPGVVDTLSFYTSPVPDSTTNRKLTICIKTVRDSVPSEIAFRVQQLLSGTRALLLPIGDGDQVSKAVDLVARIVSVKVATPAVPLLVLLFPPTRRDYDAAEMEKLEAYLRSLVEAGILSSVDSISLPSKDSLCSLANNHAVKAALKRLADRIPPPPIVERRMLQDVVEGAIVKGVFEPLAQDLNALVQSGGLHPPVDRLIRLHNRVLDLTVGGIEKIEIESLCWPIVEMESVVEGAIPFDWNSSFRVIDLANAVSKLKLPEFSADDDGHVTVTEASDADFGGEFSVDCWQQESRRPDFDFASLTWGEAKRLVWKYVSSVTESNDGSLSSRLMSKVQWLLDKTERKFKDRLEDRLLPLGEEEKSDLGDPCWENIPWMDVVVACVNYKIAANPCVVARNGGREMEIFLTEDTRKYLESVAEEPKRKIPHRADEGEGGAAAGALESGDLAKSVEEALDKSVKRKRERVASGRASKSARVVDLRLDKNSPTLRPLNNSLTSLSRRVSLEKNEMEDYEKWLTSVAAMPSAAAAAPPPSAAPNITTPEEYNSDMLDGKRRRSDVAATPVSHLLDSLKHDVQAAKLRDKMFEIDLMNMIASDDII